VISAAAETGSSVGGVGLLTIFILAIFVGFEVISKVSSTLHTPLMSGTNAIHGIIMIGAMLILGTATTWPAKIMGILALILATLNAVGGFVVTDRMLEMFKGPNAARGGKAEAGGGRVRGRGRKAAAATGASNGATPLSAKEPANR
jgi:NAD(P) transhydrogenase subunit alpha